MRWDREDKAQGQEKTRRQQLHDREGGETLNLTERETDSAVELDRSRPLRYCMYFRREAKVNNSSSNLQPVPSPQISHY